MKNKIFKLTISIFLSVFLVLTSIVSPAEAGKTVMSGDYVQDTLSVANSLKQTISIPKDDIGRETSQQEAVVLIEDYISRYRNRSQFNQTASFTTMQTALNALAGHYKNYKRPLSDEVTQRIDKELTKAETIVEKDA